MKITFRIIFIVACIYMSHCTYVAGTATYGVIFRNVFIK